MTTYTFRHPQYGVIYGAEKDGEAWVVGENAARALGYNDVEAALQARVDSDDKQTISNDPDEQDDFIFDLGKTITLVNEVGFFSLFLHSKTARTKELKNWVIREVFPSIRKYAAQIEQEKITLKAMASPEFSFQLLTTLKEAQEKIKKLEAEIKEMRPKAEYYDDMAERSFLTDLVDTAKLLGVKLEVFLFVLLKKKYLLRDGKRLLPNPQYLSEDLFKLCKDGDKREVLVTPKGRETFREMFADQEE